MDKLIILGGDFTPEPCSECGKVEELRPYGKGGAKICFGCAMKPENIEIVEKTFAGLLSGDSEKPSPDQNN